MTFLKFQQKPKDSGVYYVYDYRSFRYKDKNDKSDKTNSYGKVHHQLVNYHGRADKALRKLIQRAPDFSPETWTKLVHYAKESRKPKHTNEDEEHLLGQKFTSAELRFLVLFAKKEDILLNKDQGTIKISLDDLAHIIEEIESITFSEALKSVEQVSEDNIYKLANEQGKKNCIFINSSDYFHHLFSD